MVKQSNLIIFCAVLVSVLLYSKILPLPDKSFVPAMDESKIKFVTGTVASNPVKSSEKYYSVKVNVNEIQDINGMCFYCSGNSLVLIEASLVESLYPEKLFSIAQKNDFSI